MNPDERFKDKLLDRLSRLGEYGWHVRTSLLAFDYAVPEKRVRTMLVQFAQEGLIWLGADDEEGVVRAWNEWRITAEMFSANPDGQVRLKLLPPGAEYVQNIPKRLKASAT
jgi:hypothetical protein